MAARYNEGYLFGNELNDCEKHQLALKYIQQKQFCDDSVYSHNLDCYYLSNESHWTNRGGHRYLRPSNCSKFVLKTAEDLFDDYSWLYSYHGTTPSNISSIIKHGLKLPGTNIDNTTIEVLHGNSYGKGIYTSKLPTYSQLYAKPEKWNGHWVQTVFVVRQHPDSVAECGDEGCATRFEVEDLHMLTQGVIGSQEIQFVTRKDTGLVLHALLVKIHDVDPNGEDGEYSKWRKMIKEIKKY